MALTGRRRSETGSLYSLVLIVLFFFTTSASAAVLGIDFGTLNFKAVLVKPGIPLEIVLTKDSKRKESAAVAFKPARDGKNILAEVGSFPERAYGADALALQGRMPGEVFPNLKPLLGLPFIDGEDAALSSYNSRYPAVHATQVKELGTTVIKSSAFHDSEVPWSVEELLGMELANVRHNAESMAGKGNVVEDAVITVPAFYTAEEKRSIQRAAELAGMNVMALVSDGLAVGLDYAKSRTFPSVNEGGKPEHHIVYDMGAGSTTATLLRFQARSVKDIGRYNKTVQEVIVLGTGWDRELGGDALNSVILTDYIHKFLTKPVMKSRGIKAEEIRQNGRLMSRLWKEAEKTRQVLSANTETSSSFEELLPEVDFRCKLSRTEFEKVTEHFAELVAGPIQDALAAAKMDIKEVDSIILHGGAVRTPFVQRKLEAIVGGAAKLKSNVNADESAVFGAAFKAASLSPSFKVKEIRDSDNAGYAAGMTYVDGGKERRQSLFSATSPVGNNATTKQISFKDKEDFSFGLYQQVGDTDRQFSQITTSNLTASVQALKDRFGCEKDEISTKFSIRLNPVNGLPEVLGGSLSCDTESAGKASVGDSVKDWFGLGKKRDQQPLGDDEDETGPIEDVDASATSSGSASSSSSSSASTSKVPEKPKKRTETINVAFVVTPKGLPQPAPEEMKRMHDRLAAFDRSDKARFAREEALNVLESYTYYARDFLSNTDFSTFSTEAQRSAVSKLLQTTRDFMEQPGELTKATEKVLTEKLNALKKLVVPIQERRKETEGRPEKLRGLRSSLDQTNDLINMVKEQVESAKDSYSRSLEATSSKVLSAASEQTAGSSSKDDPDDLEEPDATSTTATEAPEYSSPAAFSPYSDSDLSSVKEVYDEVSAWLEKKEAEQAKLKPFEDPAFTVSDIEKKAAQLSEAMMDVLQKKMKLPPKSSSSRRPKSSKTKAPKKSKTSATESAEGSVTDAPSEEESPGEKPKFITLENGEEMPDEEEILRMISKMGARTSVRDEL